MPVHHLREALGDDPHSPNYVQTVPRVGYRFSGSLRLLAESPQRRYPFLVPSLILLGEAAVVVGLVPFLGRRESTTAGTGVRFTAFRKAS